MKKWILMIFVVLMMVVGIVFADPSDETDSSDGIPVDPIPIVQMVDG